MRIRSIKPEFWRSDDITSLSREHRLLFIGLWSYVDDNGVGVDDHRRIAADLFAFEDDQKEVRDYVRDGLATLSRVLRAGQGTPLIVRYTVDGKAYFYITGWNLHQRVDRPNKPRYPLPPEGHTPPTSDDDPDGGEIGALFATPSRHPRDTPSTGTGEQGNRGTGEQGTDTASAGAPAAARQASDARSPSGVRAESAGRSARTPAGVREPDGFVEFWDICPRKVGKDGARRAYAKAVKRVGPDRIRQQMITARAFWARTRTEERFIPHPATWLNQGRYEDPEPQNLPAAVGASGPVYNGVTPSGRVPTTTQKIADIQALKEQFR